MEVEIGDIFKRAEFLYKVVGIPDLNTVDCLIYYKGSMLSYSKEWPQNLLNMQKLSTLERELM